ncbi:MAG: hypothetical protein HETSPECPRED_009140 [Heterodermia speciosa]|uniref:Uncharacterized protein n=1 Tax=Heterodermia speciosa TaxID=116794 RepID=A0A8H3G051_9LECA|nr:MAG: hypothetical protein HETSPECPRED_009140 [Heterodermia speciosa]
MAPLGWNTTDEDSASEALILQLIAQDFGLGNNEQNTWDTDWDSTEDAETESSAVPLSIGMLHEVPHTNNASFQSFDGPEQLPVHVTIPKITSVQDHSTSTTSLPWEQPSPKIQTSDLNASNSDEMSKRSADAAGLSSTSPDDPSKRYSSPPSGDGLRTTDDNVGPSHRPEHETADGSEDATRTMPATENKRPKRAGTSQSFSKKQPTHSNIAGSGQQAIAQHHEAGSTQQHQPINTSNSYATDIQVDEGPMQSPSGAAASAGPTTLGDWGEVRDELPKVHGGNPDTASPYEPSQKTSTVPRRTKPRHPSEAHPEHAAAKAARPRDPFSSNHKDHLEPEAASRAKKVVKLLDGKLDPIQDSDSYSGETKPSKQKSFSDFLTPYDDEWHTSTDRVQVAELGSTRQSAIRHKGQTMTYIKIPWAGKPGWIESYVDDTALGYLNDVVGYSGGSHGRRGGPTSAQLEDNRRKRREEEPVDILVRDDETCDSIIEEMIKREERQRKGKGNRKGKPSKI